MVKQSPTIQERAYSVPLGMMKVTIDEIKNIINGTPAKHALLDRVPI